VKVLLTTEGTFPYATGGVSTWAASLISGLPHHEFAVEAVVANPPGRPVYEVPPNAMVFPLPLWGSELVEEYLWLESGHRRARRTTARSVASHLLPHLEVLLDQLLDATSEPATVAASLAGIADFSTSYDLRRAMQDGRVWSMVHARLVGNPLYRHVPIGKAVDLAKSLYRYLIPLAAPVPEADVVHASASAICALPAIVSKVRLGTPFLLTEHGIYFRERVLELVRKDAPVLEKVMFSNLYRAIAQAAYHLADRVSPVCAYNARWETRLGLDQRRVRVIYNGVDPTRFAPVETERHRPTIAWVGRIQPLKDLLTLIRAIRIVRRTVPDVVCHIYGPDTDPVYAAECRRTAEVTGVSSCLDFRGPVKSSAEAFGSADVAVLSSMSEGFPYTVVEAMMCARPVVATDVGGVAEALDDRTLLAEPQNARSLADALVRQLQSPKRSRDALGARLRQRALTHFDEAQFLASYDRLYEELHAAVR
jgi:glycosyltransferase involved in cell wall biosynthesis